MCENVSEFVSMCGIRLDQTGNFEAGAVCILRSDSGSEGLEVFSTVESQKDFEPIWLEAYVTIFGRSF